MFLLIILLPLLSSIFVGLYGYKIGRDGAVRLTIGAMTANALFSIFVFYKIGLLHNSCYINLFPWFVAEMFSFNWSFQFDSVSVTMILVVNIVSTVVHLYSSSYMSEDPQLPKFMAYLSLFTFFMLVLVTSSNFIQLFFGWEGVGLCSYLLIGFWYTRISAAKAAIKAIVINRIGDCGVLLGIFTIFYVFRSVDFAVVFSLAPFFANKSILFFNTEFNVISMICFFLFIGAVGKSAQIGLHTWLPDAMEGQGGSALLKNSAICWNSLLKCVYAFSCTRSILF